MAGAAIPDHAADALNQEELRRRPGGSSVYHASQAELERFASMQEGAELVREWGGSAGLNVGIIHDHLSRMFDRMSEEDEETTWQWFEALSPAQAKAVIWTISGS